ncbi:MAG: dihydrodipicolinate synthase family protein [Oscillospiraceae bacterium]|nr:dihydrodipicolinate synthase family protein [Oscillospiraceae bacterium]
MRGVIPVLQTPFGPDGAVDLMGLDRELEAVINDGAAGIMVFGYATEFPYLTDDERELILARTVSAVRGRVPVIASVTDMGLDAVGEKAGLYGRLGADVIMLLPRNAERPTHHGPSEPDGEATDIRANGSTSEANPTEVDGMMAGAGPPAAVAGCDPVRYVRAAAEGTGLPLMIQYAPHVTGLDITPEAIASLSPDRLFGVKSEAPAAFNAALIAASEGRMAVYAGNQGFGMVDALDGGVCGVMPGCSRVWAYRAIYDLYAGKGREAAIEAYGRFLPSLEMLHGRHELSMEKIELVRRGIFSTALCRQPVEGPEPSWMAEHDARLRSFRGSI